MTEAIKGIIMFSGGLDSTVAAHLLKSQGLSLLLLHFVLPFYSGLGNGHERIRSLAAAAGLPLRIVEEGEPFFVMVRSPRFGFGKNANPCLDCRIHRLVETRHIMEEVGASFVATGEVIGQRPKSQRLQCLRMIEKRAGLAGRLLRPLSARLLEPTIVERERLVDRERLMALAGRGRQAQFAYARANGLRHISPAGGCLLTDIGSARRYHALARKYPGHTLEDFKLIAYGRHFSLGERCRLVIARNDKENEIFEKIISDEDLVFDLADVPGPMGIGRGEFSESEIIDAASMVARYSRVRDSAQVRVRVYRKACAEKILTIEPADPCRCNEFLM
ncbi:MAG: hypothetical protein JW913_02550 [Chitinispirillaceae bacterium]|nr:hypothetical protein [Chitinispirillaceae bacterium]